MTIPHKKRVLWAFVLTLPLNLILQYSFPEMNYFVRAFWVIFSGLVFAISANFKSLQAPSSLFVAHSSKEVLRGLGLGISLVVLHILFH